MNSWQSALRDQSNTSGAKVASTQSVKRQEHKGRNRRKIKCYDTFRCPRCKTELGRKSSLIRHIKAHNNKIKPHLCEKCGRRFQEKGQLKRHDQVHTGLKPFKCENCGRCYSDNVNLKKHKQRCKFFITIDDKLKIKEEEKEEKEETTMDCTLSDFDLLAYDWLLTQKFLYEQEMMLKLLHFRQSQIMPYVPQNFNYPFCNYTPEALQSLALRCSLTENEPEKMFNGFFKDQA